MNWKPNLAEVFQQQLLTGRTKSYSERLVKILLEAQKIESKFYWAANQVRNTNALNFPQGNGA